MNRRSKKQKAEKKQYKPRTKTREQWQREVEKEKFWRKTLAEWKDSGLTIRAFAQKRGLSEPSVYSWRRELLIRDREAAVANAQTFDESQPARAHDSRGRFLPVRFLEHKKENRVKSKEVQAPNLVFNDPESRRHFWETKVRDFSQSGLTAREYCSMNNLKLATFSEWRRRFEGKGRRKSSKAPEAVVASKVCEEEFSELPSFFEVNLVNHSSQVPEEAVRVGTQAGKIELRTPAGFVLQFAAEFDTSQLLPLLRELVKFEC